MVRVLDFLARSGYRENVDVEAFSPALMAVRAAGRATSG
jgi:hypothetical protein